MDIWIDDDSSSQPATRTEPDSLVWEEAGTLIPLPALKFQFQFHFPPLYNHAIRSISRSIPFPCHRRRLSTSAAPSPKNSPAQAPTPAQSSSQFSSYPFRSLYWNLAFFIIILLLVLFVLVLLHTHTHTKKLQRNLGADSSRQKGGLVACLLSAFSLGWIAFACSCSPVSGVP